MVREATLSLVSISMWTSMSQSRAEKETHAHPQLAASWKLTNVKLPLREKLQEVMQVIIDGNFNIY
jgi:hypothetical protein